MIEMDENLVRLKNTLMNVETKGNSTVIMADCIRFIDQMITEYLYAQPTASRKAAAA